MRKAFLYPAAAIAFGEVGFFLRRWELRSAFEADTGLPIQGAPAFWALVALSFAVAALLLFLSRGEKRPFEGGYDQAFAAKGNTLYIAVMALSACLLLAAGGLTFLMLPEAYGTAQAQTNMGGPNPMLSVLPKLLLAGLCVGSFFCVLALGRNSYRGEGKGKYSLPLLLPGYLAAFWLITAYQSRAGDPIRQDYIYEVCAIIAVLLAAYFIAGFSFERGKPGRTVFFSLLAVYLCLVTLADGHDLAAMLLFGAFVLYFTAAAAVLLFNGDGRMRSSSAKEEPRETEIDTEETTDEG